MGTLNLDPAVVARHCGLNGSRLQSKAGRGDVTRVVLSVDGNGVILHCGCSGLRRQSTAGVSVVTPGLPHCGSAHLPRHTY